MSTLKDMSDIQVGDIITFRCGGTAVVRTVEVTDEDFYPIHIQIKGYHAGDECWSYEADGGHGESTGDPIIHPGPFDVVKVYRPSREAASITLDPSED